MKKNLLFSMLAAVVLTLGFAACSNDDNNSGKISTRSPSWRTVTGLQIRLVRAPIQVGRSVTSWRMWRSRVKTVSRTNWTATTSNWTLSASAPAATVSIRGSSPPPYTLPLFALLWHLQFWYRLYQWQGNRCRMCFLPQFQQLRCRRCLWWLYHMAWCQR